MRSITKIAAVLALSSSALAQWSDDFNRPNGPMSGNWTTVTGTWDILNNQGTHSSTSVNTVLQHTVAAVPAYANSVTVLDVFSNPGTTSYLVAVVIGLGGADAIQVKIQDQVSSPLGFSNIGIYHRTSATGWGAWTGTGTGFANLSAPILQAQMKVYFTNGGDTINVEFDTDFNGTPDQTYTKTGVLTIAPNFGTGVGIMGWGNVGTYGLFDNWGVSGVGAANACASANPLFSVQTGTTVGATNDGSSTCDATGNDVWYKYTAGATGGQLKLDTCGSAIDTVLSVYSGACGALTEIACNDNATGVPCAAPASALTVVLAPSQQVFVRLSDKGTPGAFTLNSSFVAFPANDACASATALATSSASGNTVLATNDGTSPCDPTGRDVWYSFTMGAVAGGVDFDTCGSAVDTAISVYSSCGGALLGCDDNSAACGSGAALLTVQLNAGQTVLVRVSDKGVGGPYVLNWKYTPPNSVCATPAGAGGAFPTSGTGNGTFPGTLPSFPLSSPLAVTVPPGSTQVVKVKLNGMYHTFTGDVQFVLQDPNGASHNLWCRFGGGNDFGIPGSSIGFDYEIYELFGANPTTAPNPIPAGPYTQSFGAWPSGTNNISNTPLSQIPVLNGTYTLHIYDWAGGDVGVLGSWELCFNGASGPVAYCTAGTSTNGCVPAISGNAQPNVGQTGSCVISVANVEGQKSGLIFYGIDNTGFTPLAWGTGSTSLLCVKPPTQRMIFQNSGGAVGQCDGSLTQDVHAYLGSNPASLGQPFTAGAKIFAQAWYRDPQAVKTTNLSNALELTVLP